MAQSFEQRLSRLNEDRSLSLSACINRGIERETLRVRQDGSLAQTPHPMHLGSKLCHPSITTDFSEVQPELITPVHQDTLATQEYLDEVHRFVYSGLEDELLWSASMPCRLGADHEIPLAQYGNSNLGRLKTTYRNGLSHRYGRTMQTICAVHYNFSLTEDLWEAMWRQEGGVEPVLGYRSRRYFDLMRNFRRFSWLPIYLFGASPAVSTTFVRDQQQSLEWFDAGSLYAPFATSLRNGNLGYQSAAQTDAFRICYNSLDNYIETLLSAILTPFDRYIRIGAWNGAEHLQVNTHILQSEAEFYTTVRAKCLPPRGVNFLGELKTKGVVYLEIRLLDVNPYLPTGIDAEQIRFLDTLLLYCLLEDSPLHDDSLCRSVQENAHHTAYRGRDGTLTLNDGGRQRTIGDWGSSLLQDMQPVAELLDRYLPEPEHGYALAQQQARLADPDLTPSARMLADMRAEHQSFVEFALQKSREHRDFYLSRPLPEAVRLEFAQLAARSLRDQRDIELADKIGFDEYLRKMMQAYTDLQTAN